MDAAFVLNRVVVVVFGVHAALILDGIIVVIFGVDTALVLYSVVIIIFRMYAALYGIVVVVLYTTASCQPGPFVSGMLSLDMSLTRVHAAMTL